MFPPKRCDSDRARAERGRGPVLAHSPVTCHVDVGPTTHNGHALSASAGENTTSCSILAFFFKKKKQVPNYISALFKNKF